jgi:hypothetical protein
MLLILLVDDMNHALNRLVLFENFRFQGCNFLFEDIDLFLQGGDLRNMHFCHVQHERGELVVLQIAFPNRLPELICGRGLNVKTFFLSSDGGSGWGFCRCLGSCRPGETGSGNDSGANSVCARSHRTFSP